MIILWTAVIIALQTHVLSHTNLPTYSVTVKPSLSFFLVLLFKVKNNFLIHVLVHNCALE